jgi:hypothetical protein
LHKVQGFLTVAGSMGDGGVAVGGGACGGGGVAGSDAVSAPKETSLSLSSCGMAPIRSDSAPLCPLVGSTGCGRFRFRLAGGAGGEVVKLVLLWMFSETFRREGGFVSLKVYTI